MIRAFGPVDGGRIEDGDGLVPVVHVEAVQATRTKMLGVGGARISPGSLLVRVVPVAAA